MRNVFEARRIKRSSLPAARFVAERRRRAATAEASVGCRSARGLQAALESSIQLEEFGFETPAFTVG